MKQCKLFSLLGFSKNVVKRKSATFLGHRVAYQRASVLASYVCRQQQQQQQ